MYSLIEDYLFLWQTVKVKKKSSNIELNLLRYFLEITNISPVNIILRNQFIFFFVKNEDYFQRYIKIPLEIKCELTGL